MPLRLALVAALLAAAAVAQEDQPPGPGGGQTFPSASALSGGGFTDPSQLFGGKAGAFFGLGFNNIQGEGLYASTVINTEFNLGSVGIGLGLPIDLLVWNNDQCCGPDPDAQGNHPHSRDYKTYGSVIRKRDWDEPQDYARLIRFVRYGHKHDEVYVLAGQMWGSTLGHGTLINRYANSLNLDHPKFGLAFDLNETYFGIETLTDYVTNPALLGGRAYVRPFGDTAIARGWAVGFTFVTDRTAPRHLQTDPTTGAIVQDSVGNPIIDVNNAVFAGGVDTEFEILRNSIISLIPYVDLNRIAGAGNGLHVGVLTALSLPVPVIDIGVAVRLEYRMMQAGYIPEYFDQTYDLGRVQYAFQPTCAATAPSCPTLYEPKYDVAHNAHVAPGVDPSAIDKKGYYGELAFNFAGFLQIGGLYQNYEGDTQGASLGLFATVPKIELVKIAGYYLRKNMKPGFDDAFKLDERSLLAASLAYKVFGPIYLLVNFQRRWVLQPGASQITAVNNFQAGIAAFASF